MTKEHSRILVVDSDPSTLTTFRIALTNQCCEVDTRFPHQLELLRMKDDEYALIIVIQGSDSETRYIETIEDLCSRNEKSNILFLHSNEAIRLRETFLQANQVTVEPKPGDPYTLRTLVGRALYRNSQIQRKRYFSA